jgi:Zn-dependent M28 family amino/carboxypeptidase
MLSQQGPAGATSSAKLQRMRRLAVGICLSFAIQVGGPLQFCNVGWCESPDASIVLNGPALESRARIASDLQFLSSDALKGRDTGSQEIDQAADFIASRFESLGFNISLFDGGPFQDFTALKEVVPGAADQNFVSFEASESAGEVKPWAMEQAFMPLALGASGKVSAPLVFAGYGITAPEQGYDDYAGMDVSGKIVVVFRGEPRRTRSDNPFGGRGSSRFAFFTTKVQNAVEHGAAGLLIVNHAGAVADSIAAASSRLENQQKQLDEVKKKLESLPQEAANAKANLESSMQLMQSQLDALQADVAQAPEALLSTNQAGQSGDNIKIPVASIGRKSLESLLQKVGAEGTVQASLDRIESAIDDDLKPISFELPGVTAALSALVETKEIKAKNVVAEFPGAGALANETIVIGAHYDHVGMGGNGSLAPGTFAIHNGADDNGSGTVTMLELAHRLSKVNLESRRRIVFIAFTAEERGLLGSKHYAREPRFPLEDTAAMINLDMVGRLSEEDGMTVFGTATAPSFDGLVDQWNEKAKLPITKDPSGYGPSDHTSFYEKQVPVLFFFTGLHSDYHRPSDDFEKINLDGMVRITDMVYDAAIHLATVEERPKFQTTGPGAGVGRIRRGPYLGVQLEDRDSKVFVIEAVAGGPAEIAGLRPGDQILKIGETLTDSTSAVQESVQKFLPGNSVQIVISRGGDEITVQAKLVRRP